MSKKTIGFIGLGVMGKSMARHLLEAGYPLTVYTRTKEKAEDLINQGAVWKESIKDLAKDANVIITMVGFPKDVEEVYFSENGILANAYPGAICIDMTTTKPSLAEKIYEKSKEKGISFLDAPVSGGDVGAKNGTLSIMVGGDQETFDECFEIFEKMGKNIVYQGKAGAGQHTKMCNQIAIAAGIISVCESLAYAVRAGLDPDKVLKSISSGAAGSWSLSNYAPRMLSNQFEPGFYVKHFIKDMDIALEEARRMELDVPGLELARSLYEKLAEMGEENSGIHALYKLWKK
ncbi:MULTISPECIES: NAD(P)-dependent oxidoreductase [Aeribacillus]|jgi:3-hydroxyisobutyrate dehydrogenase|uniref:Oxidoreductase n=1 Tax=Aeribacillus pallidus TaxID=33936 RepID=A0A165WCP0_9BACI|nr:MULTISPECIES: NAD(P)-dependent oxidoreductase [Aeribacillus]KZN94876.1 oxidoreductase [Aeribacillus pallidus]MDR9793921.1 NAD(P)-dependent oxidoreductase [Aeribacillus pallidus]MDR9796153.1 NAD(P)-dependent oxidoreductase [Aeribacillus pallidus]MED1439214.1 NAD(P)-dependent oxidoreductase [Aeribacillus composti]MED1440754.1 NAD(P)-dependent oxidoreductase [Aeribacillus composti]